MKIQVKVFASVVDMLDYYDGGTVDGDPAAKPILEYEMDYYNETARKRLGRSCKDAFEAGQVVLTFPIKR